MHRRHRAALPADHSRSKQYAAPSAGGTSDTRSATSASSWRCRSARNCVVCSQSVSSASSEWFASSTRLAALAVLWYSAASASVYVPGGACAHRDELVGVARPLQEERQPLLEQRGVRGGRLLRAEEPERVLHLLGERRRPLRL